MDEFVISNRIKAIGNFLADDCVKAVCDVGCDHGYLPIYLMREHICQKAYAMDLREGPLLKAKDNIQKAGLSHHISTLRSDGLEKLEPNMADTVVIAGMGGELIINILKKCENKLDRLYGINQIILSPHTNVRMVREYVMETEFSIVDELFIKDEGIYYNIIKLKREDVAPYNDYELSYGRALIDKKDGILREFLMLEISKLKKVYDELIKLSNSSVTARRDEISIEINEMEKVLHLLQMGL